MRFLYFVFPGVAGVFVGVAHFLAGNTTDGGQWVSIGCLWLIVGLLDLGKADR